MDEARGSRRYYWICPRCQERVPRRSECCVCGASKAERKRAHEAVTAPATGLWSLGALLSLVTLGLLWVLLE